MPWDGHTDIDANHRACGLQTDQPVAGLLTDLKARGLLDSTLVIWGGEFGRTSDSQGAQGPRPQPARLHHLAGRRRRQGRRPLRHDRRVRLQGGREHACSVNDLHATILHLLGLDHTKLTYRFNGRDFRLTDVAGNVIKDIMA